MNGSDHDWSGENQALAQIRFIAITLAVASLGAIITGIVMDVMMDPELANFTDSKDWEIPAVKFDEENLKLLAAQVENEKHQQKSNQSCGNLVANQTDR